MKLAVTQVILGLVIASACYFIEEYGVITSFIFPDSPVTGDRGALEFRAENTAFAARWISIAGLVLGLAVFLIGLVQVLKLRDSQHKASRTPAVVQTILGITLAICAWFVISWGFSSGYSALVPDGSLIRMFDGPVQNKSAQILSVLVFLVSLGLIGCGIAQYLKARKADL